MDNIIALYNETAHLLTEGERMKIIARLNNVQIELDAIDRFLQDRQYIEAVRVWKIQLEQKRQEAALQKRIEMEKESREFTETTKTRKVKTKTTKSKTKSSVN